MLVVGAVAALAGGRLLFQAERRAKELSTGNLTLEQARATRDAGAREQRLGSIALGVGLAAAARAATSAASVSAPAPA